MKLEHQDEIAFAEIWTQDQFSLLTTSANEVINHVHDRMPVILAKERWRVSLADTSLTEIEAMLEPYDARETDAYPVMNRVGSVKNDDEGLIKPLV